MNSPHLFETQTDNRDGGDRTENLGRSERRRGEKERREEKDREKEERKGRMRMEVE